MEDPRELMWQPKIFEIIRGAKLVLKQAVVELKSQGQDARAAAELEKELMQQFETLR